MHAFMCLTTSNIGLDRCATFLGPDLFSVVDAALRPIFCVFFVNGQPFLRHVFLAAVGHILAILAIIDHFLTMLAIFWL